MRAGFGIPNSLASVVALSRARVRKVRPPQVDGQELGPQDATLMVRKEGVGTITFDTTTGDTTVSGGAVSGGAVLKTWVLDGGLSKKAIEAMFSAQKAEDDAAASANPPAEGPSLASVREIRFFDEAVEGREAAENFVADNSMKWKWIAAVRYREEDGREGWMMGGWLAD